jgi:uncharacterized protein
MLRLSSYAILSERLPGGGYALMNGATGAVDIVTDACAKILTDALAVNACDPHPHHPSKARYKHDVRVSTEEIPERIVEQFLERGHFTRLSHAEERAHVAQVATLMHEVAQAQPHFLIVPNLDCNYRCTYCFERPMQIKLSSRTAEVSYARGNVVMRPEHVDAVYRAIDVVQAAARARAIWDDMRKVGLPVNGDRAGGLITLYGGEPLDAANKDIVFEIVRRGVARGHLFAAITNGHDLGHFLPVLGEDRISQVQISIDGPKRLHDKSRIARNRQSSFDAIVANVNTVLGHGGCEVQLRCHVDPKNLESFGELLGEFEAQGWLNHPSVVVYATNYHVKDKDGHVTQGIDYGDVLERWRDAAGQYANVHISGVGVHAERLLMPGLTDNQPARLKGTYCGANAGTYIFAADGMVYSCWESVGKECSRIGSYMGAGGLSLDPVRTAQWFERSVAKIPECLDCCYALVCGGGCAQYAEYNTGSLYKPYCDEFEVMYPAALARTIHDHRAAQRN